MDRPNWSTPLEAVEKAENTFTSRPREGEGPYQQAQLVLEWMPAFQAVAD